MNVRRSKSKFIEDLTAQNMADAIPDVDYQENFNELVVLLLDLLPMATPPLKNEAFTCFVKRCQAIAMETKGSRLELEFGALALATYLNTYPRD